MFKSCESRFLMPADLIKNFFFNFKLLDDVSSLRVGVVLIVKTKTNIS
jgi:hypothetical protein